jgi:SOS-response transcriptional repressor LexA
MNNKRGRQTNEEVYWFVEAYLEDHHGRSPTIREIKQALRFRTTSTVKLRIDDLVAENRLVREPGARGLHVPESRKR